MTYLLALQLENGIIIPICHGKSFFMTPLYTVPHPAPFQYTLYYGTFQTVQNRENSVMDNCQASTIINVWKSYFPPPNWIILKLVPDFISFHRYIF